jgi:hypothetical protein
MLEREKKVCEDARKLRRDSVANRGRLNGEFPVATYIDVFNDPSKRVLNSDYPMQLYLLAIGLKLQIALTPNHQKNEERRQHLRKNRVRIYAPPGEEILGNVKRGRCWIKPPDPVCSTCTGAKHSEVFS